MNGLYDIIDAIGLAPSVYLGYYRHAALRIS